MTLVNKPEVKSIKIKKAKKECKFKAKTNTRLYTLVVKDLAKAAKIESNLKGKYQGPTPLLSGLLWFMHHSDAQTDASLGGAGEAHPTRMIPVESMELHACDTHLSPFRPQHSPQAALSTTKVRHRPTAVAQDYLNLYPEAPCGFTTFSLQHDSIVTRVVSNTHSHQSVLASARQPIHVLCRTTAHPGLRGYLHGIFRYTAPFPLS